MIDSARKSGQLEGNTVGESGTSRRAHLEVATEGHYKAASGGFRVQEAVVRLDHRCGVAVPRLETVADRLIS